MSGWTSVTVPSKAFASLQLSRKCASGTSQSHEKFTNPFGVTSYATKIHATSFDLEFFGPDAATLNGIVNIRGGLFTRGSGQAGGRAAGRRGRDLEATVSLSFEDSLEGVTFSRAGRSMRQFKDSLIISTTLVSQG